MLDEQRRTLLSHPCPCVFLRSLPGASRHPARWCLPPPLCTRTLALALRLCAWAAPPVAVEPLAKGEASNASGCHTDKCGLLQSLLQKQRHFLCVSFPLQRNRPSVQVLLDSVLKVGCLLDVRQHAALQVAETIHIDVAVCAPWRLVRKSVVLPWIQQKRLVLTAGSGDDNRRLLPEKQGGEALAPRVQ